MLKHGLIASDQHWNNLKQLELTPENIEPFVVDSMNIKQYVVEQDFKEQNVRKTLNFGHTIGHAIESLFFSRKLQFHMVSCSSRNDYGDTSVLL